MFSFFSIIFKLIFYLFKSKKSLFAKIAIVEKENQILKRHLFNKKVKFNQFDRLLYAIMRLFPLIKNSITLVKPETVLSWQKKLIKGFWTFKIKKKRIGRPPTPKDIQYIILDMKNSNLYWGNGKIKGELKKLGIDLDKRTIAKIIQNLRKKGKVKTGQTWKNFFKTNLESIYAMDFFTVDICLNKRFYVFVLIKIKTREIIQSFVTIYPNFNFVRQMLIEFENNHNPDHNKKIHLIHDRSHELLYQNYKQYGIKNIPTTAKSPNLNAFIERFIGSIRRECLDYLIIYKQEQLTNIVKKYIFYYNTRRPHQGLGQNIPSGYSSQKEGKIIKVPVVFGLHHHYYRKAA